MDNNNATMKKNGGAVAVGGNQTAVASSAVGDSQTAPINSAVGTVQTAATSSTTGGNQKAAASSAAGGSQTAVASSAAGGNQTAPINSAAGTVQTAATNSAAGTVQTAVTSSTTGGNQKAAASSTAGGSQTATANSANPRIVVNGYAYPSISEEVLDEWLPSLTFVSAFSYGITPKGELIGLEDDNIVDAANDANVAPLLVLTPLNMEGQFSNELARMVLESEEAQNKLIESIISVLKEKNMAGVDFDFEYVYAENKQQYVDFVAKTTKALNPLGYVVTVALAPKVSEDQVGLLYEGHDYAGMAKAANLIMLMTYEWGYTFGPPLAVAPLESVKRVLNYGISEIPADKILMGVPNYGYDWALPYIQGSSRAEKITLDEATLRADRYGAEIQFDEVAKSPFYYYTDVDGREHIVWYENVESWTAKFRTVLDYGFAGVSFWNIMSYSPAAAEALKEYFDVVKLNDKM